MNVSLQGARSQARLDWDQLETERKASAVLSRRILAVALVVGGIYLLWKYLSG
jgi:hypothetical protein